MSYGLSGNALQSNGTPAAKVFVREWDTGRSLSYVVPDGAGDWEMKGLNPIKTYEACAHGASGYQPIAHGPLTPVLVTDTPVIDLQFGASNTASDTKGHAISTASGFTTESDGSSVSGYRLVGGSSAMVQMTADNAFRPLSTQFAFVFEIYMASFSGTQVLVDTRPTVYNSLGVACYITSAGLPAMYGPGVGIVTAATAISTGTWTEVVFQRRNMTATGTEIYVNGVQDANTGNLNYNLTDNAAKFFRQQDNVNSFLGKCRRARLYVGELMYA